MIKRAAAMRVNDGLMRFDGKSQNDCIEIVRRFFLIRMRRKREYEI